MKNRSSVAYERASEKQKFSKFEKVADKIFCKKHYNCSGLNLLGLDRLVIKTLVNHPARGHKSRDFQSRQVLR